MTNSLKLQSVNEKIRIDRLGGESIVCRSNDRRRNYKRLFYKEELFLGGR